MAIRLPSSAAIFRFIMQRQMIAGMGKARKWRNGIAAMLALLGAAVSLEAQQPKANAPPQSGGRAPEPPPTLPIDAYIPDAWKALQPSISSCTSLVDPKVQEPPVLYV